MPLPMATNALDLWRRHRVLNNVIYIVSVPPHYKLKCNVKHSITAKAYTVLHTLKLLKTRCHCNWDVTGLARRAAVEL